MAKSVASEQLSELVSPKVMSQSELARQLDVSPQLVSDWVHGRKTPSSGLMRKIEDLLGIPMRSWMDAVAAEEVEATEKPTGTER